MNKQLTMEERKADLTKECKEANQTAKKEAMQAIIDNSSNFKALVQNTLKAPCYTIKSVQKEYVEQADGSFKLELGVKETQKELTLYQILNATKKDYVESMNALTVINSLSEIISLSIHKGLDNDNEKGVEKCKKSYWTKICDIKKGFNCELSNRNINMILKSVINDTLQLKDVLVTNKASKTFYHSLTKLATPAKDENGKIKGLKLAINNKNSFICFMVQFIAVSLMNNYDMDAINVFELKKKADK